MTATKFLFDPMEKSCYKCGKVQPLADFYARNRECKTCTKLDTKERYAKLKTDPIWVVADRKRNRELHARYRKEGKVYIESKQQRSDRLRGYKLRNPDKTRAHYITQYAIKTERIRRMPCRVCGLNKSEAHHEDYDKPLEITWFCKQHHMEYHAAKREAETLGSNVNVLYFRHRNSTAADRGDQRA